MKMYVANASKQVLTFIYRIPEQNSLRMQTIHIGQQVALSDDLRREDIDAILDQHVKYGMIPVSDVRNVKTFAGYCYSIDTPVKMETIEGLLGHNQNQLIETGKSVRRETAVAMNNGMENAVETESGGTFGLREMEVSVIEENPERNTVSKPVAEGFRVSREIEPAAGGRQGRGRRGRS